MPDAVPLLLLIALALLFAWLVLQVASPIIAVVAGLLVIAVAISVGRHPRV